MYENRNHPRRTHFARLIFVVFGLNCLTLHPNAPPPEGRRRDFMTARFMIHYHICHRGAAVVGGTCCSPGAGFRWLDCSGLLREHPLLPRP